MWLLEVIVYYRINHNNSKPTKGRAARRRCRLTESIFLLICWVSLSPFPLFPFHFHFFPLRSSVWNHNQIYFVAFETLADVASCCRSKEQFTQKWWNHLLLLFLFYPVCLSFFFRTHKTYLRQFNNFRWTISLNSLPFLFPHTECTFNV